MVKNKYSWEKRQKELAKKKKKEEKLKRKMERKNGPSKEVESDLETESEI